MRVVPPLSIGDSILTSSTVSEPDAGSPTTETVYSAGVTYGLGAEVISTSTHRKYESLQAANTGNPLPVLPETTTAWWLDIGPTNKWAMFDLFRNTTTRGSSPLIVTLTPGVRINSFFADGMEATSITVTETLPGSPTEIVYTHTEDLITREVLDWYDYFFELFSTRPSIALFDIPSYTNGILTITMTNTAGEAVIGSTGIGSFQYIGVAQQEAESDALNFSTVTRETTGEAVIVQRRTVPKTHQQVFCDKTIVNAVRNLRTALNGEPAFWSALDDSTHDFFDALQMIGFYRTFTIRLSDPTCIIDLELEGL